LKNPGGLAVARLPRPWFFAILAMRQTSQHLPREIQGQWRHSDACAQAPRYSFRPNNPRVLFDSLDGGMLANDGEKIRSSVCRYTPSQAMAMAQRNQGEAFFRWLGIATSFQRNGVWRTPQLNSQRKRVVCNSQYQSNGYSSQNADFLFKPWRNGAHHKLAHALMRQLRPRNGLRH